jgi:hypothetical protein
MGLTENILQNLNKDELKFVEKTAFRGKDSQAKTLYDLVLKFGEDEEKYCLDLRRLPQTAISMWSETSSIRWF